MKPRFALILSWIPAFGVMAILFYASHLPGDNISLPPFPHSDKVVHFLAYTVLGAGISSRFSLHRQLSHQGYTGGLGAITPTKDRFGWLVGMGYGVSDEIHQLFIPMRQFGLGDICADMLGVIVGSATYLAVARKSKSPPIN